LVFRKIQSSKQSLKLKSYVTITAVEAVVLICYCANFQFTLQTISGEVENILTTSLGKYATNRTWRLFWDQFQQHYYCCGSSQNTNWFQTAWVSPITVTSFSILKKYKIIFHKLERYLKFLSKVHTTKWKIHYTGCTHKLLFT